MDINFQIKVLEKTLKNLDQQKKDIQLKLWGDELDFCTYLSTENSILKEKIRIQNKLNKLHAEQIKNENKL